ncbi:RPM1-interacting protein 4 [Setaria italica]|uniref:RPM1-interacting protein 4 n=1 Tax=Setaria italica TaxID=4555 RepID=UPI000BE57725|nr:RPM1-interacting protein 4 [Setaria italica]
MVFVKDDTGRTLPKFGEWDVNNPASADGFTVIFSKARDEKKAPTKGHISNRSADSKDSSRVDNKVTSYNSRNNASKKWFCCVSPSPTQS